MTIDDYIEQRNDIQLEAEAKGKDIANKVWMELGVANRHIERVLSGLLTLRIVENEIVNCLERVKDRFSLHEL